MPRSIVSGVAVAAVAGLLAACGAKPKFLAFNYQTMTLADESAADALAYDIGRGARSFASVVASPCNFTADFSAPSVPRASIYGQPGRSAGGVRLDITAQGPASIATGNAPACPAVAGFALGFGSRGNQLYLGRTFTNAGANVGFANGQQFDRFGEGRATFTGYDSSGPRIAGSFLFVVRQQSQPNRLLLMEGSFDMPAQPVR